MTLEEIKKSYTLKQLQTYNSEIRSKYNNLRFEYNQLQKQFDLRLEKELKTRTADLTDAHKKEIKEKDEEIKALKLEIAKLTSKLNNNSSNSGIPTSKTAIGEKKYIPNTREKTDKSKGGQKGHTKHKLYKFKDEEITERISVTPIECDNCHSKEIEVLDTGKTKDETDYIVKVIKRRYTFNDCHCLSCGNNFHAKIPNELKEENQYGPTVKAMAISLTNEIYTPFNKTVKLVKGITNGEINLSESYVAKLQKKASDNLESFIKELKEYIPKQEVYGWDDGVIDINTNQGILRIYCTDEAALFVAHEHKDEASLDEDGILLATTKDTVVMHDHVLHNYNEKYDYENVECVIHLIRRLNKMKEKTNHNWCEKLKKLLSETNKERNKYISEEKLSFEENYINEVNERYDAILSDALKENDEDSNNYFFKEEISFINDLKKYKKNYLLWIYRLDIPATNNSCERGIRPVKSKLKISGMFQNIKYAEYYARIRSYIETCKQHDINIIDACSRLMQDNPYTLKEILAKPKKDKKLS